LGIAASAAPGADPVAAAVEAEELGFDFISCSDHPAGTSPSHEVWTLLSFIAARTTRIRVATRVLGVPYRSPAMVAKMAETLDRLSDGRLILGLGGGSADEEHRAFGLGVRTPREKVDGLEDAIRIIRGLWTTPGFSYAGRLYRTEEADLEPKPAHSIPIWLGTFGPRALAVTGRLADGWIPSLGYAGAEQLPAMRGRVLDAARAVGRDRAEVTCALNVQVHVGSSEPDRDPTVIAGAPEAVAGRLRELAALGFTVFNFIATGPGASAQPTLLAREIIPRLRTPAPSPSA
jgi:alkanesulfonate monooxygenase SsuD/methylene tetrahydromethanopterin reductase-like flavin-dependent oxidoreductase (luciferase family)